MRNFANNSYSEAFKKAVVTVVEETGCNVTDLSDVVGIRRQMVYRWRKNYRVRNRNQKPTDKALVTDTIIEVLDDLGLLPED